MDLLFSSLSLNLDPGLLDDPSLCSEDIDDLLLAAEGVILHFDDDLISSVLFCVFYF